MYLGWSRIGSNQTKKNARAYGSAWHGKQCISLYSFTSNNISYIIFHTDINYSTILINREISKTQNSRRHRMMPRGCLLHLIFITYLLKYIYSFELVKKRKNTYYKWSDALWTNVERQRNNGRWCLVKFYLLKHEKDVSSYLRGALCCIVNYEILIFALFLWISSFLLVSSGNLFFSWFNYLRLGSYISMGNSWNMHWIFTISLCCNFVELLVQYCMSNINYVPKNVKCFRNILAV